MATKKPRTAQTATTTGTGGSSRQSFMDFLSVSRQAPSLLEACISGDLSVLRTLRLVSKELSQLALLTLTSYTLKLEYGEGCRAVSVAKMLRPTRLHHLSLHLTLSGCFSPTILLEAFVREAGASLHSITSFELHLQDSSGSAVMAAALDAALISLLNTCPVIKSLCFSGHPSHNLLQEIGKVCPLLTSLASSGACANDLPYLASMLQHQSTLLPHITTLAFQALAGGFELPDISGNHGIEILDVCNCYFTTDTHWLCLPRNLKILQCRRIESGPPPKTDGTVWLPKLERLEMASSSPHVPLKAIAQLVVAAPQLLKITAAPNTYKQPSLYILFEPTQSSMLAIANQLVLLSPLLNSALDGASLLFDAASLREDSQQHPEEGFQALSISAMPRIVGARRCFFNNFAADMLSQLLACFPDVTDLELQTTSNMNDMDLQAIAACVSLSSLTLYHANQVSPAGILLLCHGLPGLETVKCSGCEDLDEDALARCRQLVCKRGLLTHVDVLSPDVPEVVDLS